MKKMVFIIILTGLSAFLKAQNSFPTSNAIWNESIEENFNIYGLLGDTIINEMQYSKLYQFSDTVPSIENTLGYIGAFRNENHKVFFRPKYWTYPDILLYDFDAEIGDTVWHNAILYDYYDIQFRDSGQGYSIITSIANDNNGTVFSVSGPIFENLWIEGVGSEMGVLRSITTSPLHIPASAYQLNCFKQNDTVKYLKNPLCDKCFCSSNNSINENCNLSSINIYPNPTKDVLIVENIEDIEIKTISIYSMDGKLVERNKYSFNREQLNIRKLAIGNYIINIETDKGNLSKLIIKN